MRTTQDKTKKVDPKTLETISESTKETLSVDSIRCQSIDLVNASGESKLHMFATEDGFVMISLVEGNNPFYIQSLTDQATIIIGDALETARIKIETHHGKSKITMEDDDGYKVIETDIVK